MNTILKQMMEINNQFADYRLLFQVACLVKIKLFFYGMTLL